MSHKSSSQILPLLSVGSHIRIKAWDDMPEIPAATVTHVFEDGFGAMASGVEIYESDDDFYLEMYEDQIDQVVDIVG
jgi:hypothetical protein